MPVEMTAAVGPDGILNLRITMGADMAGQEVNVLVQPVEDQVVSHRGSRKHVLDLLDADFSGRLSSVLTYNGVTLELAENRQPQGVADAVEWTVRHFCHQYGGAWEGFDFPAFDQWWVPDQYRNPQWDLLSTCRIDGRRGLLLVEAKAHAGELKVDGKLLNADASDQARLNHDVIGRCIAEAATDLRRRLEGIAISRDTHYQLSNRVATAWKLAQCGLPVALLYLGFIGDTGISDVGVPLTDGEHWQRAMGAYLSGVLPQHYPGQVIRFDNGGSMRMLIKSLPVVSVSPRPRTRPAPNGGPGAREVGPT